MVQSTHRKSSSLPLLQSLCGDDSGVEAAGSCGESRRGPAVKKMDNVIA